MFDSVLNMPLAMFSLVNIVADSYNHNNWDHDQDLGIFAFSTIHIYFL